MRYRFYTADVFTDHAFGGNPLAVFPDGGGLDSGRMQNIAREFNLSETTFVLPPEDPEHTRRVRIFTPVQELPFAGHPTVGTAHVLAATGEIPLRDDVTTIVFEEGVGPVPVAIHEEGGRPVACQFSAAVMPEYGPAPPPTDEIAAVLSLEPADLMGEESPPRAVSCGLPFLFVTVRDRAALGRVRIDPAAWERVLSSYWAPNVYIITFDAEISGSDVRARMFSPLIGLAEDPATGSAATALPGYLCDRDARPSGTFRWIVEQGFEMGRPSMIEVEAVKRDGAVTAIRVGGRSVMVSEGEMEVPD